jgi:hypothetical protein
VLPAETIAAPALDPSSINSLGVSPRKEITRHKITSAQPHPPTEQAAAKPPLSTHARRLAPATPRVRG